MATKKQQDSERTIYIVLSYLGILSLIPLLLKKDDKVVQFHAKQGLVIFLIYVVIQIIGSWLLFGVLSVIYGLLVALLVVVSIVAIVKGVQGEMWKIPVIIDLAEKF